MFALIYRENVRETNIITWILSISHATLAQLICPSNFCRGSSQTSVAEVKHRPLRIVRGWGTEMVD